MWLDMEGGAKSLAGRLIIVPLLAIGMGLGIFLPNKLLSKPSPKTPVVKVSKDKKASAPAKKPSPKKHLGIPAAKKVILPVPPPASPTSSQGFYSVADDLATSRYGASNTLESMVAVSRECNNGYAVVIWHNSSSLTSTEIYLHDGGQGYRVVSGAFTRYGAEGAPDHHESFGSVPSGLSCFES